MRVFISWSGEESKAYAEILRSWLPSVIQALKPYYSPLDIPNGSRWAQEIGGELEESHYGILCLTPENLSAPWILFEAGALSKSLSSSRVCPLLFGLEPADLTGPLVQFQCLRFDRESLQKLLQNLNEELGDRALSAETLHSVFDMWWPRLEAEIENVESKAASGSEDKIRSDRQILEEILELSREAASKGDAINASTGHFLASLVGSLVELAQSLDEGKVNERDIFLLKRIYRRAGRLTDDLHLDRKRRNHIREGLRTMRSEIEQITGRIEQGDVDDYEEVV